MPSARAGATTGLASGRCAQCSASGRCPCPTNSRGLDGAEALLDTLVHADFRERCPSFTRRTHDGAHTTSFPSGSRLEDAHGAPTGSGVFGHAALNQPDARARSVLSICSANRVRRTVGLERDPPRVRARKRLDPRGTIHPDQGVPIDHAVPSRFPAILPFVPSVVCDEALAAETISFRLLGRSSEAAVARA